MSTFTRQRLCLSRWALEPIFRLPAWALLRHALWPIALWPIALWPIAVLLLALSIAPAAWAQTTPDAGSLLQQTEPKPAPLPNRSPLLRESEKGSAPSAAKDGLRVQVQAFQLQGRSLLTEAELQQVLGAYIGKALNLADLQQAAAAVSTAYADAGWLAYCYLPRQDISAGTVRLVITEARFGGVRLEGQTQRLDPKLARAIIESTVAPQAPLNLQALDRALLLLSDLPGLGSAASLVAGEREGETAVALRLADTPALTGLASLDNTGARSTGATRLGASLALNSLLGRGEQFTSDLLHSQGSDYARLGASLPVGLDGLRLSADTSSLRYRLSAADFSALDGHGASGTLGLAASYPLLRARAANVYLQATVERKRFDNWAQGSLTSNYRSVQGTLALSGNRFDELGGGGANAASLAFSQGQLNLAGSPNEAADAQGPQSAGRFKRLRYGLSRQQALGSRLSVFAGLHGQWADKNLDSSEKLYLGGAQGVRAYPASEGGGSSGQALNLELRGQLPLNLQATGFYDWGRVTGNVVNNNAGAATTATAPNRYSLKGVGASLAWTGPAGLDLRLTWARRVGDNPAAGSQGRDQDGTLTRNRVWLQASLPFSF